MIDTHKSREVWPDEWAAVHYMRARAGYRQVLALKYRIGQTVCLRGNPDDIFMIHAVGMDATGDIVYFDRHHTPFYDTDLEDPEAEATAPVSSDCQPAIG